MDNNTPADPTIRFDRMCEHLARLADKTVQAQQSDQRGDLNLGKDGAQHRRYHALFDDLQN